jgi:hypothetical protein
MSSRIRMIRKMIRIHTVWESENSLHVRTASHSWERSTRSVIPVFGAGIAPPSDSCDAFIDVGLAFRGCVAGYGVEVWREWDFGFIDVFVVGFECCGVDFSVVVSVYVVECRCPWTNTLIS